MTEAAALETALRAAIEDRAGPALRAAGYDESGSTWRRRNPGGDWAVVDLQTTASDGVARCVVGLAVVPGPWLDFMGEWLGRPPHQVNESLGLYRERLTPSGSPAGDDGAWQVADPAGAAAVAEEVAERLKRDGLPLLDRLLDRDAFLATLRAGDLGMIKIENFIGLFPFAEAVLLSDDGPSDRLEELLELAHVQAVPERKDSAARYAAWIRARARAAGPHQGLGL